MVRFSHSHGSRQKQTNKQKKHKNKFHNQITLPFSNYALTTTTPRHPSANLSLCIAVFM